MKTEILKVDEQSISTAAELIRAGEVVAFPTETVYGLGADALNPAAIQKIFIAKDRPSDNPLIVHVANESALEELVTEVPEVARKLMREFWPGPLSIVLKKSPRIPVETTAGLPTVVIRCPAHPVALQLITEAGTPIAAPSANRSGHVSPTSAQHVADDLSGQIPLILDGGVSTVGLESTVIDCSTEPAQLLRPGTVTQEEIESVIGEIVTEQHAERPASPGMKYRHYAPKTPVLLFESAESLSTYLNTLESHTVVLHHSHVHLPDNAQSLPLPQDPQQAAAVLYERLRSADALMGEIILIEGYQDTHIGRALMNRLRKAEQG